MSMARCWTSGLCFEELMMRGARVGAVALLFFVVVGVAGCVDQGESVLPDNESESWLYAQTAKQGTVTAADVEDCYTIEMTNASATTIAFTDRPAQNAVSIPTTNFVNEWETLFGDNPPNASIVFDESEEVYVFALSGPVFHPVDHTLAFLAKLIPDGSMAAPPEEFDFVSVFIDDAGAVSSGSSSNVSNSISLDIAGVNIYGVDLSYSALPVSQPRSHNSYVALFAGTDVNVYEAVPVTQQEIVSDATAGYSTFRGLELSESQYTAAYATNYDQRTICAVVAFDKDGSKKSASTTTIAIDSIGSDSISLSYSTPAGNKPSTNGNWIAVWRNPFSPSNGPLVTKSLSSDSNAGSVTINDFEMTSGTSYTIGYMTGADASSIAATVSFSN